jgi:hypothetical protein
MRESGRDGFVLLVVVFVLFAVGMAAATGYAVVNLEADLSSQAEESAQALAVARGGLERYMGEHLGIPEDSTVVALPEGSAVVRARRVAIEDSVAGLHLYLLESEGTVIDPVNPDSPARERVSQYARLHTRSVGRHAAALLSYQNVSITNWGQVRGNDHGSLSRCPEAGSEGYPGIVHRGTAAITPQWDSISIGLGAPAPPWSSSGAVVGVGAAVAAFPNHDALFDAVGVRWDILTDPDFPVEYDGVRPGWGSLASNDYPVVRWNGDLSAGSFWSGRGVLIVTGTLTPRTGFVWDGLILAGELADTDRFFWVRGMLVAGMNGARNSVTLDGFPYIFYDVCSALAASESLAYFEPLPQTWSQVR